MQGRDWEAQEQLNIILQLRRLGHKRKIAPTCLTVLQQMMALTTAITAREQLCNEFRLFLGVVVTSCRTFVTKKPSFITILTTSDHRTSFKVATFYPIYSSTL